KKLGFRTVMDVIPLKAELVKGSHGRIPESELDHPVFLTNDQAYSKPSTIKSTDVFVILDELLNQPDYE
ncbi:MAG: alkaline phosphatase family protein, partial [Muricauda sp.]|nr:alkaline phosphatase family protein [Allomuricauda sp.]